MSTSALFQNKWLLVSFISGTAVKSGLYSLKHNYIYSMDAELKDSRINKGQFFYLEVF